MLSIAELAHQRDPKAIAEVIRQELHGFEIGNAQLNHHLEVVASIIDSNLELQIRTYSVIDKQKLLTLVTSKLQNLRINSVAKYKIHCWRNDETMPEQRLLWTEQFMLEPLNTSVNQSLELDEAKPQTRVREPRLSKNSVLQQAIEKIAPTNHKARAHFQNEQLVNQNLTDRETNSQIVHQPSGGKKSKLGFDNEYWQLLLVGLSIILLGLGIGAFAKAITLNSAIETKSSQSTTNSPVENISQINKTKNTTSQTTTNSVPSDKLAPNINQSRTTETINSDKTTPSANASDEQITSSPNGISSDTVITLEKFNRIQKGMSLDQVDKIFGVSGKLIAENNSSDSIGKVYSWKNTQGSNAIIEFKDGQVVAKAQAGL